MNGRHVLWMLFGFFAVIVMANAIFIWLALSSWSGLSTENAYQQGLKYNQTLARAEAQRSLDWRLTYELDDGDDKALLTVRLANENGDPLSDAEVVALFSRPTHEDSDHRISLNLREGGAYTAAVSSLRKGQWDLTIEAMRRDGTGYRLDDRIWVK